MGETPGRGTMLVEQAEALVTELRAKYGAGLSVLVT